jgi:hypothetical protein
MNHDGGYHLLFSHPRMVSDLLGGFVGEPWVAELDLETLERVNARFHADGLDRRDGDVIWRARRRDGREAYLYLAIEFQSTVDRWMAVRLGVYVLLFYLHLIREGRIGTDGLLPPVFPVCLYNGDRCWTAATDLSALIAPGPEARPWPWRPHFRYHLIDEQRAGGLGVGAAGNIVAVLFDLERCRTVAELQEGVGQAVAVLSGAGNATLRRAFARWIKAVLAPARGIDLGPAGVGDLSEVRDVLADRVREWELAWERNGLAQGLQQGKEQGRTEGEARALIRLMERRFGALPEDVRERIATADLASIEAWFDRAIAAASLDAVFAAPPVN